MKKPVSAVKILKKISEEEINLFETFLTGLYASRKEERRFFEYLRKQSPTFLPEKTNREALGNALYPENPRRLKKVSETSNALCGLLKEFLWLQEYREDSFEKDLLEFSILEERGLKFFSGKKLKSIRKTISNLHGRNISLQRNLLDESIIKNLSQNDQSLIERLIYVHSLSLDEYYFANRAKLWVENFIVSKVKYAPLDQSEMFWWMEFLSAYVAKNPKPNLILWEGILKLAVSNNCSVYDEFFQYFKNNYKILCINSAREIFYYLQFGLERVKYVNPKTLALKKMDALTFGLETRILLIDGSLTLGKFHQIVNEATKLKMGKWLENFIAEYGNKIDSPYAPEVLAIAEVKKEMSFGRLNGLGESIDPNWFKYPAFRLASHTLKVMILTEVHLDNNPVLVLENLDRMKYAVYRNRRNVGQHMYRTRDNFVRLMYMIINNRLSQDAMLAKNEKLQPCAFASWVTEKIYQYSKKEGLNK